MSTLYLIRHGQAGFAQAEYDILSELGAAQSHHLGRYCASAELKLDALYCAPRRRHRETAQHLRSAIETAGGTLPETLPAPAFDEFPFGEILASACATGLAEEYESLRTALGGKEPLSDARAFGRLFTLSMQGWAAGKVVASESFVQFVARVREGLTAIMKEQGAGRHVAVITSAGAIAAALMSVLELSSENMLKLCLSLYNTGVSELRYRDSELSVVSVNGIPHLLRGELRSVR